MTFERLSLAAIFGGWFLIGFFAWLPWVAINGPHRPLTRLAASVVAAEVGALVVPLAGIRGGVGLLLSLPAALIAATVSSLLVHLALRSRSGGSGATAAQADRSGD